MTKSILQRYTYKYFILLLSAAFLVISGQSFAQSLKITDFVLYANNNSITPALLQQRNNGYGISIGNGSKITSGSIGGCYAIKTTGAVSMLSNLRSGHVIQLSSGNTVNGNISVANLTASGSNIFSAANSLSLKGNLDVNGNIKISSQSSVIGTVTHPLGTQYSGPLPTGGEIIAEPALPLLPKLPPPTAFAPAGAADITASATINPGAYNNIKLTGNNTITFSGQGVYIFSSINNLGNANKFVFDFANSPSGIFQLEIHGDVNLGSITTMIKNGGDASRIYAETHGNGTTFSNGGFAWSIDNASGAGSSWSGTVYAPNGGINIGSASGSSKIKGALWSGVQIRIQNVVDIQYVPLVECNTPNVNAGEDKSLICEMSQLTLQGSSSTPSAQYAWTAINGGLIVSGANSATPAISKPGTYILTVTTLGGCMATDTAIVKYIPCIKPYYPPSATGKVNDLIGSELTSLYYNFGSGQDTLNKIFTLLGDSVLVEVISLKEKYNVLLSLLQTPAYGLTDLINNGPGSLIISGKYPIANLKKLDSLPELIDYARPVFPPVGNSGLVNSSGDTALYTNLVRNGYNLSGEGVKIGVISNSYNTLPGNPAQADILNGDLPGTGNSNNPLPVHVLRDYPYGQVSDEGRAMLQIVHDIAPKAALAFRTGFISAGDFGEGIRALNNDSCNIIVDDVTFITEPFFTDGVVSRAVDDVTANGVSYFTAAGNFGNKAYRNQFHPAAAPAGLTGYAHDFGTGDIHQSVTLAPGTYTIVLQWNDDIYSLNPSTLGAKNDFDIYLTDNSGNILFGFNRNNLGGDPIEIMPFTVTTTSQSNILIVRAAGTGNVDVEYVVFRGEAVINEYNTGNSTIVGQANSAGAMTVGAVLYSNTPAYGVNPPTIASFSSVGGNAVNGVQRNKPDFAGPNGINTTVQLGGVNIDGDLFPNFFGTSAAAPHIAGVAALVMEAKNRYYFEHIAPQQVRTLLQSTSVDMSTPGYDTKTGFGFVQADAALRSFASPTPSISELILPDTSIVPGTQEFVVTVKGNYLTDSTKILFRGEPLNTTVLSSSQATAVIPPFGGYPSLQAYTAPVTPSGLDGGYSDSLFFFAPIKKNIIVTAKNATKHFGEQLPAFGVNILIDSIPIDSTDYALAEIGLDSIYYTTPATSLVNTGIYYIRPAIKAFDPLDSSDVVLKEMFNYTFNDGFLSVNKMPLLITPDDTTLTYGDKIGGFNYKFDYPDSLISVQDKSAFLDSLEATYRRDLSTAIALADSRSITNVLGRPLVNADLENLSFLATENALSYGRPLVNFARPLVNGLYDTTYFVDIAPQSIFDYQEDSASATLISASPLVNAKALVNAKPLVNGRALVNAKPLVNASPLVNSSTVGDSTKSDIVVIIDSVDANNNEPIASFKPINLVSGTAAGVFAIVPGAFLTNNFDVKYQLGNLNINKYKLKVKAADVTIVYGNTPVFNSTITGYQYSDDSSNSLTGPVTYTILNAMNQPVTDSILAAGTYSIVPNLSLVKPSNYSVRSIAGTLKVMPAPLTVKADNKIIFVGEQPVYSAVITGFIGKDSLTIVSGPLYKTSPVYSGLAGTYTIIPYGLSITTPANYAITYVSGTLYVNPDKKSAKRLQLKLDCIELLGKNKPGFVYTARFSYTSTFNTPYYIPIGPDNLINSSGNYNGAPPEVFLPGKGYYNVDVAGSVLTWTIQYYQSDGKIVEKAVSNTSSTVCAAPVAITTSALSAGQLLNSKPSFKVYPNPAADRVTIHAENANIYAKDISLFDLAGKSFAARILSADGNNIVLNVSQLSTGMYVVKIKNQTVAQSLMIMKQ